MPKYIIKMRLSQEVPIDQFIKDNSKTIHARENLYTFSHLHIVGDMANIAVVVVDPAKSTFLNYEQLNEFATRSDFLDFHKCYFKIHRFCRVAEVYVLHDENEKSVLTLLESRKSNDRKTSIYTTATTVPLEKDNCFLIDSIYWRGQVWTFGSEADVSLMAGAELKDFESDMAPRRNLFSEAVLTRTRLSRRRYHHEIKNFRRAIIQSNKPIFLNRVNYNKAENQLSVRQQIQVGESIDHLMFKPLDMPKMRVSPLGKARLLPDVTGKESLDWAEANHKRMIEETKGIRVRTYQKRPAETEPENLPPAPKRLAPELSPVSSPEPEAPVKPLPLVPVEFIEETNEVLTGQDVLLSGERIPGVTHTSDLKAVLMAPLPAVIARETPADEMDNSWKSLLADLPESINSDDLVSFDSLDMLAGFVEGL